MSDEPLFEIPAERLPPGFAESVEKVPERPAEPRPAATAVLLRDGDGGPEALLLRRRRETAFVPGAWVFPGGRVDRGDGAAELLARVRPPSYLAAGGGGKSGAAGRGEPPGWSPPAAFWVAAAREVFEETGVALARDSEGEWLPDALSSREVRAWREELLEDGASLLDALYSLDASLDLREMVYCAHWITPAAEPRRFDTRFFLARLPSAREVEADPREMTDALWLRPAAALERFREGSLPMVFPTVRTLEALEAFSEVEDALEHFRALEVRAIEPRLVRTGSGVGIVVDKN